VFDGPPRFPEQKDGKGQLLSDQSLKAGDPIFFNVYFRQNGPNPVVFLGSIRTTYLETDFKEETEQKLIAEFKKISSNDWRKYRANRQKQKREPPAFQVGQSSWNSAYGFSGTAQPLHWTQDDLNALRAGNEVAVVLTEIAYEDNHKPHHARRCEVLQPPAIPPGTWHLCDGFNGTD